MPLDFPPPSSSPYTGSNGVTYVWDGQKWVVSGSGTGPYLLLAGGTMTGPIALAADPATDPQAANKHYVDASINLAGNYLGTWAVASNTPNINAGGSISNANYVATTVNPAVPETVPVGVPGIAGLSVGNGDRVIWASGLGVWQILRNAGVTLAAADARYYAITNPSGYQTAANVTTTLAPYAPLASPVFTGNPTAPTPTAGDNDASIATTAFVTNAVSSGTAGVASFNTRTGAVTLSSADVTTALTFTPYNATNPSGYQTAAQVTTALSPYALLAAPVFTGDARAVTPTTGDNDTSVATTAFVQTAVAPYANNAGRNLLHNALFNVAQRGVGPFSVNGYTADRWAQYRVLDTGTVNLITLSDANRNAIGDQAATSAIQVVTTGNAGATALSSINQPIEGVRRLAAQTVTVSFYATASSGTPKLGVSIDQSFGTGGSPSAYVTGTGQSVTLGTTWPRYTVTIAVPSVAGKTLGTNSNDASFLNFWFSAGANSATASGSVGVQSTTVTIWGVQLEIGSVATPLVKRDPADELTMCQRFYQALAGLQIGGYAPAGGGLFWASLSLPVVMRANPTVAFSGVSYGNASGLTLDSATTTIIAMHAATVAAGAAFAAGNFTASADL